MSEYVIIVCGGRTFSDKARLFAVLDAIHLRKTITQVHHGDAQGADRLADAWAKERGISVRPWPADWTRHGKSAGPRRNAEMLHGANANLLVAFPGGKGTADMIGRSEETGLKVLCVPKPSPVPQT